MVADVREGVVDDADHLFLRALDFVPGLLGDVDLLREVVLELGADRGDEVGLQLLRGHPAPVHAHQDAVRVDAFEEQHHPLVRLQAQRQGVFLLRHPLVHGFGLHVFLQKPPQHLLLGFKEALHHHEHPGHHEEGGYKVQEDVGPVLLVLHCRLLFTRHGTSCSNHTGVGRCVAPPR